MCRHCPGMNAFLSSVALPFFSLRTDSERHIRILRKSHDQYDKHHKIVQRHLWNAVRDIRYGRQHVTTGSRIRTIHKTSVHESNIGSDQTLRLEGSLLFLLQQRRYVRSGVHMYNNTEASCNGGFGGLSLP